MKRKTASQKEIARWLKVTPRWIQRLTIERNFPKMERGAYDIGKVVAWYVDYRNLLEDNARSGRDASKAENRLIAARAGREELRLSRESGELIAVADVIDTIRKPMLALRAGILSLPKRATLLVKHAKSDADIQRVLETIVHDALSQLSGVAPEFGSPPPVHAAPKNPRRGIRRPKAAAAANGQPMGGSERVP